MDRGSRTIDDEARLRRQGGRTGSGSGMSGGSLVRRRAVLAGAAGIVAAALLPAAAWGEIDTGDLSDMTTDIAPIAPAERAARIEQARQLMRAHGLAAIVIEPGASLVYFTGVHWSRSERLCAAVLPARGEPILVCSYFEEPSIRQTLAIPAEIRTWNEDEDPTRTIAGALRDRGLATGTLGIEETVRYFAVDGFGHALPQMRLASANPVVRGCRMLKSPAEIALMQAATDVTMAAYRWTHARVRPGMSPRDVSTLMNAATAKLGGSPEFALVLMGDAAALPHGSRAPQQVREGEVVLMDCGCTVQGYQSDVSRTFVPGAAPAAVRAVWETVAEGQRVALRAARIGRPAGSVDDAVRGYYESRGYGPGYRLPGLSHRTGHGIGLDGHEPVNLVHGEAMPLAAGMCFSDEPGLYLPGRFGVRLEDCFHMSADGPHLFSGFQPSLERPFG